MRMAIPYYGRLLRPGFGLERIYFHVEVDNSTTQECSWSLQVWDPVKAGLCSWLQNQGVSGLVCRDSYPLLASELDACGIQTHWDQDDGFARMASRFQNLVD